MECAYPSRYLLLTSYWFAIRGLTHGAVDAADEAEETGWKFVHADVFRFPEHPNLFAAVIGTGTQMTFMTFAIFALALVRYCGWRDVEIHYYQCPVIGLHGKYVQGLRSEFTCSRAGRSTW